MDDRADVGDGEVVDDVVLAGLDVDFDFGEAGDERLRLAVARIVVAWRPPSVPGRPALSPTPW